MPTYTDEQLDREVLYWLKQHRGRQNAMGRWELVERLFGREAAREQSDDNPFDRQIRKSVVRLRRAGALVCDMGDGHGRYLAATVEEYQAFRQYYGAGAFEKLDTIHKMDKAAEAEWPDALQMRLL